MRRLSAGSILSRSAARRWVPRFLKRTLNGKKIALFGSNGWGDGEWMRNWEKRCTGDGAVFACDSVICCEAPDDDAVAACRALGAALA